MDENAAASLALDAYQALQGIGEDVAQIKAGNSDVLAAIESLRQTDAEGFRQLIARDSDSLRRRGGGSLSGAKPAFAISAPLPREIGRAGRTGRTVAFHYC